MKIAIIDKKGAIIKVENQVLKVDEQKIPLRLIDTIILASNNHLESKDMINITKEGITFLLLSAQGKDSAIVTSTQNKNAEVKLAQYMAQKNALNFAKYFVSEKITRHGGHLREHDIIVKIDEVLQSIHKAEDIATLLGIEGSFSRFYFSNYFALFPKVLHSGKRTKNPPRDPVNAMMSFFYMLVYNLITIRLLSFGFEPSIGFLHQPFRSHNALSSDFMELFRADINAFVFRIFDEKIIENSDFTKKNGVYLRYEGRKKIWGEFKMFTQMLEPKIDSEIANIRSML